MNIDLYPHQIKALGEMKNGCILRGGVGTGKSRTALCYYIKEICAWPIQINGRGVDGTMERPTDLYIVTTARKRNSLDWQGEVAHFGLSANRRDSVGGVQVTTTSWNLLSSYVDVEGAFFIFDEARMGGSGAWSKAFIKITKNNQWIVLSATPGDIWSDYIPIFVAHEFYKNRTEFVREHVVYNRFAKYSKIDRYIGTKRLNRQRDAITVEMPYARHTRRHVENVIVEYDKALMERVTKDRWHVYEDRPIKDIGEMFIVMRKVVNSDVDRLGAVMKLAELHPRLIIFYSFDYELEMLRTLGSILDWPQAEYNGHKHQDIPEGEKWIYLVQYTSGAEAWNCITTDTIIFYSLNYSYRITEQAKGRIDRLNTPYFDLWYYMLRSNSQIDNAIVRAIAQKKVFNEKDLLKELKF